VASGASIATFAAMFAIRAMTAEDAEAIAAWHYPGPYAFYDWEQDPGRPRRAARPGRVGPPLLRRRRRGELAGFFVFKPRRGTAPRSASGCGPTSRPRASGARFLEAGLRFGGAERYTLAVAAFNRRAITVYERAGFTITAR
jgi:ribosomal-protein-alanine N-acetyltransferase